MQLCVLRWRGHFLHDTRGVPGPVLETIASQLGVVPIPLETYPHNKKTRFEHVERIRDHLHFRRCDAIQRQRLLAHLITVAHAIPETTLSLTTPLVRKHINPFGKYHFDLDRMR